MTGNRPDRDSSPSLGIDTTVPHSARIWNYWLGGTDNFAVDRRAGKQYLKSYPQMAEVARAFRLRLRLLPARSGWPGLLNTGGRSGQPPVTSGPASPARNPSGSTAPSSP
jgi:S-adenosyl methyltransferase